VAGDKVLREVAEVLNRVFRKSDTLIRYGGDEFLVLMPESDEEQAVHAGTRLAQRMRVWREKDPSPARSLGVSCGIATYRKGGNIQEVIRAADENMYTEKTRHHAAMQDAVKAQSA
jgi:diguanylate cyclase (GGDEF)-like protein